MKLTHVIAVALTLSAVACSKHNDSPAPGGTGGSGAGPVVFGSGGACANPIQNSTQNEITVNDLVREQGKWVLVSETDFDDLKYTNPGPSVWGSLDPQQTQHLQQIIANDSQLSLRVSLSGLDPKTVSPGAVDLPHQLLCTTADTSPDTSNQTHTSHQDMNFQLPYSIDANSLIASLAAKVDYTLDNGTNEKIVSQILVPDQQTSLKILASQAAQLAQKGFFFHIYRVSPTTIKFVIQIVQSTTGQVNLSDSSGNYSSNQNVTVPLNALLMAEGTYQLN